jgi:hypothetical protein
MRVDATYENSGRQDQPQEGGGEPDSKSRRMIGALPAYPHPNNVEAPMAPTTQAHARPGIPPNENKDEIDNGGCKKEERDEKRQYMMQGS